MTGGRPLADFDPAPGAHEPGPRGRHRLVSVRLMATRNRRAEFARPLPGERLGLVEASERLADLSGAIDHRLPSTDPGPPQRRRPHRALESRP